MHRVHSSAFLKRFLPQDYERTDAKFMQMIHKQIWRAAFAATSLACVTILSGCGGASNGTPLLPTPTSGPAVNGLSANDALGGTLFEVSGLASADASTAYLTGPVASTAKPSTVVASSFGGTIPLGFAPDGSFGVATLNAGTAVAPGASVIFGANISGGNSATAPIAINPNSVVLTSPEVSGFSQPLKFTTAFSNQTHGTAKTPSPLAAAQYATAVFTLPFTTTGLHSLRVAVSDAAGQSSTTDFDTVVVGPSDGALYAANIVIASTKTPGTTTTSALSPGDVVELDDPTTGAAVTTAGARQQATADGNGVAILFAPAGTYAVKATSADGKTVTVQQDKAGKATTVDLPKGSVLIQ